MKNRAGASRALMKSHWLWVLDNCRCCCDENSATKITLQRPSLKEVWSIWEASLAWSREYGKSSQLQKYLWGDIAFTNLGQKGNACLFLSDMSSLFISFQGWNSPLFFPTPCLLPRCHPSPHPFFLCLLLFYWILLLLCLGASCRLLAWVSICHYLVPFSPSRWSFLEALVYVPQKDESSAKVFTPSSHLIWQ